MIAELEPWADEAAELLAAMLAGFGRVPYDLDRMVDGMKAVSRPSAAASISGGVVLACQTATYLLTAQSNDSNILRCTLRLQLEPTDKVQARPDWARRSSPMDMGDTEKRGEYGDHAQGREVADHRPDDLPVHVDSDHGRPGDVFDLRQTARHGGPSASRRPAWGMTVVNNFET